MFSRKQISVLAAVMLTICSCEKKNPVPAMLELEQDTIQVDTLYIEEAPRQVDVHFTNTGDKDLRVFDISTSCDCVTAEVPEEGIKGHKKGVIKATINVSEYLPCDFEQNVYINTNTFDSPIKLTFQGVVRKKQN